MFSAIDYLSVTSCLLDSYLLAKEPGAVAIVWLEGRIRLPAVQEQSKRLDYRSVFRSDLSRGMMIERGRKGVVMASGHETSTQPAVRSDLYFGPFRLEGTKHLWRGERLVEMRPRPLAVLRYLAGRPGQFISSEELLKRLWPGIYVTKTVLRVCVHEIRQALEEDPTTPQFVETVGRQGYRFIAPLATTPPPVTSYQQLAVGSSDTAETKPPQLGPENWQRPTPFVGRRQELARLHEVFERVRHGERQIMFLLGESGIGKTTLVDRFLDQVRTSEPVRIGQGQCVEQYGSGEAYLPLLEALGQLCREPGGEQVLAVLHRHAPTWLAQMPGLLKAGELEAVQRQGQGINRERMLRELAEAIEAIAADAVLVLVLEDLQWSDPSTLDVLGYLAQRRRSVQLYILGTYRPADVVLGGHPLRQVVQELYGRRQCEELALELLSEAEVEEYLQQRAGRRTAIAKLSQMIYRRTDGNALFMVSFVDYLLQQGLLAEDEGQGQLRADLSAFRRLVPTQLAADDSATDRALICGRATVIVRCECRWGDVHGSRGGGGGRRSTRGSGRHM